MILPEKLALFLNVDEEERPDFEAFQLPGYQTVVSSRGISTSSLPSHWYTAELISLCTPRAIDEPLLAAFPQLRLIVTRSTGYNQYDLEAMQRRGISLCNCVNYSTVSVAEHVLTLLLMAAKRLLPQMMKAREGVLHRVHANMGNELAGKTLGVWGTGQTGLAVLRLAGAFGMRLLASSRTERLSEAQALGFQYVSMDTLLAESDFLSLHAALTPETQAYFNHRRLSAMKPGSVLINTGRGGLVDPNALVEALDRGPLSAAALDVLIHEPILFQAEQRTQAVSQAASRPLQQSATLLAELALMQHPRVILTPHTAYYTHEAMAESTRQTMEAMLQFVQGSPVRLVLDARAVASPSSV